MTSDDLDRLAHLIAAELTRLVDKPEKAGRVASWVPAPVRPEPPGRAGEPAPWTGAAQSLGDVAPGPRTRSTTPRDDLGEATAVIRGAAAGRGPRPSRGATERDVLPRRTGRRSPVGQTVPIGVSNRHLHLSAVDVATLFGAGGLRVRRALSQPGQFAAEERVRATGPGGTIDGIRVVGPARGETQLELALSDAAALGVQPPVLGSGQLAGSTGGITLHGTGGHLTLVKGVIIAARHLHVGPDDAERWGLRDGDRLTLRCGNGPRAVTWHEVLVRAGPGHATEFHLDADEARAAAVTSGDTARIVSVQPAVSARKQLFTERDVLAAARRGEGIPPNALLTPSARDRARALGLSTS
jgi:putative phosphotransacetylase